MDIKTFWQYNKKPYLWSCLAITLGGLFIGLIKNLDMNATSTFILFSFPVMFLMSFGIAQIGDNQ